MPTDLRLLIVEDSEDDAALLLKHLERVGCRITQARRVETQADFEAALSAHEWDAVLADHALPRFSAPAALAALQASGRDLPFIVVSGVIDEESAVGSLRAGAHDFVTKANLARLGPALERELRAAAERRAHRQQEASFQLLFHHHPLPMWVYELETLRILEVNQAATDHYGYTRAEFLNLTLRDLRPPDELPRLEANLAEPRQREERSGPWVHRLKSGALIEVEISSSATVFAGRPARLVLANDITERLRAERALRASEDRFRDLVENSRDLICTHDLEGRLLTVNPWAAHSLGYAREDMQGRRLADFLAPESLAQLPRYLKAIARHGAVHATLQVLTAAGEQRLWEFDSTLRTAGVAQPVVRGMAHDITERQRLEDALRRSEARYRHLIDNLPGGTLTVYDQDLRLTLLGGQELTGNGLPPDAWRGKTLAEFAPPASLPEIEPHIRAALAGETRHAELAWGDQWYALSAAPLRDEHGAVREAQVVALNITARKQAEAALWESEQKYRTLVETTEDVILMADLDGRQVYRNPAFYASQGLDPKAPPSADPFERIHPDDIPKLKAVLAGLQTRGTHQYEYRLQHTAGHWMHRLARSTLLRDPSGQPAGVITIVRDITERQAAEDRIQRQVAYLSALREIDRAITSSLDLRLSLSLLLTHAVERLGVEAAAVLVFNPATQELLPVAELGLRVRAADLPAPRLGRGPAGRAALERRLVHIPDLRRLDDDPRAAQIAAAGAFGSQYAVPLIAKGEVRGVLEVYRRAPGGAPGDEWLDFLNALAGQAAIAVDNAQLFSSLQRTNTDLGVAIDAAIEGWARSLHLRDQSDANHSQRVAELTVLAGRELGLSESELVHVRRGALLHDLGKLALPDSLLLKPGPLDAAEWALVRQHPAVARDLLEPIAFLRPALDIPYGHHEKWDGTGYPRALQGEAIPLSARLFAVVNVWDALTSDRPYRAAWTPAQARAHLQAEAGRAFDPRAVRVVLGLLAEA